MKTYQEDHKLMNLLKITEISRIVCDTNMGTLKLSIRKGERNYRFLLDAVELPKDLNKELFELLYPVKTQDPTHLLHNLNGATETFSITDVDKVITVKNKANANKKAKTSI